MGPSRIMIIRHAEKHAEPGVTVEGRSDEHSLTVRGWQRAGALVRLFGPDADVALRPDVVYASAIGPESETRRPQQTVGPLVDLMREHNDSMYDDRFLKPNVEALVADVLERTGTVLIAWEHSRIPAIVAALPHAPAVPSEWPKDRYDLVWVLDRSGQGWDFRQIPQLLLSGDQHAS
ncbi:phosphoglycerate mutase family protein [Lichenibacterium minor]|uniref:Phosphoglycerate mutase family protein n=1 Tax=Lichenibacterium minor TaxID=2316528 RepID=A0A4Q2U052_9HYPH|nr:phosphoglycerate mutase family protein [Lichenibacterium minor]